MKRLSAGVLTAAVLLALLSIVPGAATAQQSDGIFPFDYEKVELDNGFTAYFVDAGAPGQIAYVSMVRTGSRDEVEEGRSGFAHFFEHMMFRGTEKYPDFDAQMASIGASRNAFTSNDMTVYYAVAANDYLEKIIDLESDRFQNLSYSEEDFRTEAGAVLGEYQQSATSPFGFLNEKVRETAFDVHPYGHTTIGYEADVRAMPQGFDYARSFFQRFYRPENVVLVVAGDFDFDRAEELVREYYGDWEPGYRAPDIPEEPEQRAPRDTTVHFPGRTLPILDVNWKAPAWDPGDRVAVATEVLGNVAFGSNSDIYRELVVRERRVQFLAAGFGLSRDPGLVSVTTMISNPADVEAIEKQILATAERYREELVPRETLEVTKSNMRYRFLMNLENAQGVAFALITPVINTGTVEAIDSYYETLARVTPEDVREAARRVVNAGGRTTVLMVQAEGERTEGDR